MKKDFVGLSKLTIINSFSNENIVYIDDYALGYKISTTMFKMKVIFLLFNNNLVCDCVFHREYFFFQRIKI